MLMARKFRIGCEETRVGVQNILEMSIVGHVGMAMVEP